MQIRVGAFLCRALLLTVKPDFVSTQWGVRFGARSVTDFKQVAPWIAPVELPGDRECDLPTSRGVVQ